MTWLAVVSITILYAAVTEYAIHRWAMHWPFPWRTKLYTDHHVEHHGHGDNTVSLEADPLTTLALSLPLLLVLVPLVGAWASCLWISSLAVSYSVLWNVLHASFHGVGCNWAMLLPGYFLLYDHHTAHHRNPRCNYGTVFFWSDYLFGTKF